MVNLGQGMTSNRATVLTAQFPSRWSSIIKVLPSSEGYVGAQATA
jgi:hypothetical protein